MAGVFTPETTNFGQNCSKWQKLFAAVSEMVNSLENTKNTDSVSFATSPGLYCHVLTGF